MKQLKENEVLTIQSYNRGQGKKVYGWQLTDRRGNRMAQSWPATYSTPSNAKRAALRSLTLLSKHFMFTEKQSAEKIEAKVNAFLNAGHDSAEAADVAADKLLDSFGIDKAQEGADKSVNVTIHHAVKPHPLMRFLRRSK